MADIRRIGSRAVPGKSIGAFVQAADLRCQRLIEDSSICYFQILCAPTTRMWKFQKTVKRVYSVCCLGQPLRARYACVPSAMLAADGLCRDGRTQGVLSGGKERAWKTRQLWRVCEWTNGSEIKTNGKERGRSAGDLQS